MNNTKTAVMQAVLIIVFLFCFVRNEMKRNGGIYFDFWVNYLRFPYSLLSKWYTTGQIITHCNIGKLTAALDRSPAKSNHQSRLFIQAHKHCKGSDKKHRYDFQMMQGVFRRKNTSYRI